MVGGFLERARINLTTSAATDREMSDKAACCGLYAEGRDFHPQAYYKRCGEGFCVLMALLKDSLPPVGRMCSLVYVRNWVCAGLHRHSQNCDEDCFLHTRK